MGFYRGLPAIIHAYIVVALLQVCSFSHNPLLLLTIDFSLTQTKILHSFDNLTELAMFVVVRLIELIGTQSLLNYHLAPPHSLCPSVIFNGIRAANTLFRLFSPLCASSMLILVTGDWPSFPHQSRHPGFDLLCFNRTICCYRRISLP